MLFRSIDIKKYNIVKVLSKDKHTIIFGQLYELLNKLDIDLSAHIRFVSVIWGVAGWSRTQLLGEIARGGWGISKSGYYDNKKDQNILWEHFLEKEKVIFCGENDYLKIFK